MHAGLRVELGDERQHLSLGGSRRQLVIEVREADRTGVLLDLSPVELGAGVIADEDGGHARLDAACLESFHLRRDLLADLLGDGLAVDDLSCHGSLSCSSGDDGQSLVWVMPSTSARSAAASA